MTAVIELIVSLNLNFDEVNLTPKTEIEEIIQNVQTILSTVKGEVPLDRSFGISPEGLDLPIAAAQTKITASAVEAVNKFEPRAKVKELIFSGEETNGVLNALAVIEIDEEKLRGGVN